MKINALYCSLAFALSALFLGCQSATSAEDEAQASDPITFTVASYNIKHSHGMDGKKDLDRTSARLTELKADWIALQEVDNKCARSGKVDQAQKLADDHEMKPGFASFMDYQGGQYGLGSISALPIKDTKVVELPEGREPRTALWQTIEVAPGVDVAMVCIHLDYPSDDAVRVQQAQALLEALVSVEGPVMVTGDFNDVPGSTTLKLFEEAGYVFADFGEDNLTCPSDTPNKTIDHFAVKDGMTWKWEVLEADVQDEPLVSDHRPIVAKLQLMQ